jgi:hypothetical protein
MDIEQFDRIAKGLGSGASRRRLLRLGSALLPVGLLAAWQWEAAGAQQRDRRQRDVDGDGLRAVTERRIGTVVRDPDTDDDLLLDGAEFRIHGTDPRIRDTDRDGLLDGEEVNVYGTHPARFDTDGDGVGDCVDQCSEAQLDSCIQLCGGQSDCVDSCFNQDPTACFEACLTA